MSWKSKRRRRSKQERKAEKKARIALCPHLLMQGWKSEQQYTDFWRGQLKKQNIIQMSSKAKEVKKVSHDDMVTIPWKWSVQVFDREKNKLITVHKDDRENPPILFCQGDTCFLQRNGKTQKLTPMHQIKIHDRKGNKFEETPRQVALWAVENQNDQYGGE